MGLLRLLAFNRRFSFSFIASTLLKKEAMVRKDEWRHNVVCVCECVGVDFLCVYFLYVISVLNMFSLGACVRE